MGYLSILAELAIIEEIQKKGKKSEKQKTSFESLGVKT
jgi:hypothetical protein